MAGPGAQHEAQPPSPLRGPSGPEANPGPRASGGREAARPRPSGRAPPSPALSQARAMGSFLLTSPITGVRASAFRKLIKEDMGLRSPLQSEKGEIKNSSSQQRVRRWGKRTAAFLLPSVNPATLSVLGSLLGLMGVDVGITLHCDI